MFEPLCTELQPLLDAELARGNAVATVGAAPGSINGTLVLLAEPFRALPDALPAEIQRIAVNDPHWWHEEVRCTLHQHVLASPFA